MFSPLQEEKTQTELAAQRSQTLHWGRLLAVIAVIDYLVLFAIIHALLISPSGLTGEYLEFASLKNEVIIKLIFLIQ